MLATVVESSLSTTKLQHVVTLPSVSRVDTMVAPHSQAAPTATVYSMAILPGS